MYTWISEDAREQLDDMLKCYENELEETKIALEKKQEDYQKPFYKLSHWQAKLGYDYALNQNMKKKEYRKIFFGLKSDLLYGVNSLSVQIGTDNMSVIKRNVYETLKKCYKMYNRILTNLLSNPSLSDDNIIDYAHIASEMRDFLNQVSFRIPRNVEMKKNVSLRDLDQIAAFPNIYSICELALLKDWSYEEFLNLSLIYHNLRDNNEDSKKELKEDMSNIYEFDRKELLLIKKSLLNEASDLNEEIEKQNQKLELIKKINQYL